MKTIETVKTSGREATDEFFEGGLDGGESYPFLIFSQKKRKVEVVLSEKVSEVLSYPDETRVMKQWQGKWRSDFFHFSVGSLRAFRNKEKSKYVSLFPQIESIHAVVNRAGRVEHVKVTYLDHEYDCDRPTLFYNSEKAMEFMEEALSFNPKIVKVTKNSRSYGKVPDEEYDGKSWLKSHEVFVGRGPRNGHRSWSRIMSEQEKRQCGLAPLLSDTNYLIELNDESMDEPHYYGGIFDNEGKPEVATKDKFWRCTRPDTAERHLQKIKDSGDTRVWSIKGFQRKEATA